jgi:hypothetical protein
MNTPRSSTETLIKALRVLAHDIKTEDGVANTAISEAADRLEELHISSLAIAGPWKKETPWVKAGGDWEAVKDIEGEDYDLDDVMRWDPIVLDRRRVDITAEPGMEAFMTNEPDGQWVEYDIASAIVGGLKNRNQILSELLSQTFGLLERLFQSFEPQCHDDDVLYKEAKNFIAKVKREEE